ncbi:MAG: hypothetical protein AMJ45_06735 [Syntrophobacter sp. DG_60]|nr:MAG: hypothetical protein AMJ45_06735 [Syntrophobacter sp. DG_60]
MENPSIYQKIKQSCTSCQIVLLYEKDDLVCHAIIYGVYACIKALYDEREILTILRHFGYR